mmetsp:Transcript_34661/g.81741  ORF Transcript_34661/g.81741 Transcript_34661/m.81741 type:complete len:273 (-) Transcript_34661:98-916(-)|eukprot:CAMPEP_0172383170 /NCGR_PEP_ID=MMETSP1061-20121228/1088_1 /TAXON_ID=37318 /ORGANISM="Pseudo-nitzschia pungens, Strain cf. pungens" /LENGTH=272 /DNA_ID=CAMNT_0013111321 /DNA_START=55 /DNA_END=873 /DNA_ORIENTATION=-
MPTNTEKRVVTKTVNKTPLTLPGEILKVKLGNAGKYDYLRVFFGGPDGETPIEYVLHRPIGKTGLDDEEWVLSPPGEYALLLKRENDPGEKYLRMLRESHKKDKAASKNLIKIEEENIISYPSGMKRNVFLSPLKEQVKETVKARNKQVLDWKSSDANSRSSSPPSKLDFHAELEKMLRARPGDENAKAELAFSAYMADKEVIVAAEEAFPDVYETLGGAFADTKQVPVSWAKGLQRGQIQQVFARYLESLLRTLAVPPEPAKEPPGGPKKD